MELKVERSIDTLGYWVREVEGQGRVFGRVYAIKLSDGKYRIDELETYPRGNPVIYKQGPVVENVSEKLLEEKAKALLPIVKSHFEPVKKP